MVKATKKAKGNGTKGNGNGAKEVSFNDFKDRVGGGDKVNPAVDVNRLKEIREHEDQARAEKCKEEVFAVLQKHGCNILPYSTTILPQSGIDLGLKIIIQPR